MAESPLRTYKVSNPGVLFARDRRIVFRSAAPVGSVATIRVDGRRVRVVLDDYVLYDEHGTYLAAEIDEDAYL